MQTITTKYMGPTNHRGSRVKARSTMGAYVVLSWDYALGTDANHDRAACELASQLGWLGRWCGGDLNDSGRVYLHPADTAPKSGFIASEVRPQCRTVATRL